ncbi:hypothetical protein KCP71_23285 [Salmonella enterica subsp. enterica]|nr:hypothetical protein KCP71_23285 [Salmonella enterica subsp. enterica]
MSDGMIQDARRLIPKRGDRSRYSSGRRMPEITSARPRRFEDAFIDLFGGAGTRSLRWVQSCIRLAGTAGETVIEAQELTKNLAISRPRTMLISSYSAARFLACSARTARVNQPPLNDVVPAGADVRQGAGADMDLKVSSGKAFVSIWAIWRGPALRQPDG